MTVSLSTAQDNSKPAVAEPSSSAAQPAAGPDGDYVGAEVCVTCHADQQKSFVHTIMGNAMAHPKTELDKLGCEACHGPGEAHVEAGGGKETIPVRFTKDSTSLRRWPVCAAGIAVYLYSLVSTVEVAPEP